MFGKLRKVFWHIAHGFSIIVSPHGTGTSITFDVPGRVATTITIAIIAGIAGLAFLGITYARLASLSVKVEHLKVENEKLRQEQRKIDEIKREIAKIERMRQQIELWAGVATKEGEDSGVSVRRQIPATEIVEPNTWPRKYTYALLKPFYEGDYVVSKGMVTPVEGFVSRTFLVDAKGGAVHPGVDIAAATGTPVRCALRGKVSFAGWDDVYGNLVIVDHGDSLMTIYGHNEKLLVKEGDDVRAGQIIATVGNTGRSTAPHLHFGVIKDGKPVDPMQYVSFGLK